MSVGWMRTAERQIVLQLLESSHQETKLEDFFFVAEVTKIADIRDDEGDPELILRAHFT